MLSLTARDIMTREVVTVRKGASVEEALAKMAENDISGLPVVDVDDHLVGIITESDVLLKGQFTPAEDTELDVGLYQPREDGLAEAYRKAQSSLVEEAMTRKVLAFMEESLVVDIARAMVEQGINRVPIIEDRKVVGIVSRKDVIRAMSRAANGGRSDDEVRSGRMISFD